MLGPDGRRLAAVVKDKGKMGYIGCARSLPGRKAQQTQDFGFPMWSPATKDLKADGNFLRIFCSLKTKKCILDFALPLIKITKAVLKEGAKLPTPPIPYPRTPVNPFRTIATVDKLQWPLDSIHRQTEHILSY